MDIKTAILHYYPYWILGICMIIAIVFSEYKNLMRFQLPSFLKFARTMLMITCFRCVIMYFFPPTLASAGPILQIPLWLTLFTPWEDAVHIAPLILAGIFLGDSKLSKVILFILSLMVQISFGLGHIYQSVPAAIMISFYIPIVKKLALKYGMGTTMACHIFYDFVTLLTVRIFLGL